MSEPMTDEEIAEVQSRVDYATELSRPELLRLLGDAGETIDTLQAQVAFLTGERDGARAVYEALLKDMALKLKQAEAQRDMWKQFARRRIALDE